ncbi:MAG: aminotransferase class V-fold PLP-dependent enzyme [Firmicutes bacterium]|nr:aminotransferase class V-fold PLP-dependent enzyme [Bacillota bacterium]
MIYLDNGATTFPKPECVYKETDRFAREGAVNAGRGAYKAARRATEMIREVKTGLLSLVDARGQAEVALTPSVTIALNQIIQGQKWKEGMTAYVTPYEHNAVLRPLKLMEQKHHIRIAVLPLKEDLSIDMDGVRDAFAKCPPDFVAVTAISNVTGYVLPAAEIFTEAKKYNAFTVLDAAQAMGLLQMRFAQLKADCVAFAGHKTLYAPFGVAGFLIKNDVDLELLLAGGNGIKSEDPNMPKFMPEKMECASMDSVAICGLHTALAWLKTVDPWKIESELMDYLLQKLPEVDQLTIYKAPPSAQQAGVISINIKDFRANEVAAILDKNDDIAVRAGHHCAGMIHKYLKNKEYDGTIRISLGVFNTKEDIDALIDGLKGIDREALKGIDAGILRGNC